MKVQGSLYKQARQGYKTDFYRKLKERETM